MSDCDKVYAFHPDTLAACLREHADDAVSFTQEESEVLRHAAYLLETLREPKPKDC